MHRHIAHCTLVRREAEAGLAHLRDHLHQRQFASGCREEALALRLVQDLVQPRETMIRYAPLRAAMTDDPRQLLEQVFTRYVQRSGEETKSRMTATHTGQRLVEVLQSSPQQGSPQGNA
jgi:Protein of unknown function (DUF3037)